MEPQKRKLILTSWLLPKPQESEAIIKLEVSCHQKLHRVDKKTYKQGSIRENGAFAPIKRLLSVSKLSYPQD